MLLSTAAIQRHPAILLHYLTLHIIAKGAIHDLLNGHSRRSLYLRFRIHRRRKCRWLTMKTECRLRHLWRGGADHPSRVALLRSLSVHQTGVQLTPNLVLSSTTFHDTCKIFNCSPGLRSEAFCPPIVPRRSPSRDLRSSSMQALVNKFVAVRAAEVSLGLTATATRALAAAALLPTAPALSTSTGGSTAAEIGPPSHVSAQGSRAAALRPLLFR